MENKQQKFNDDLSVLLSTVRECLDHWGLKDWKEYLVVRRPGKQDCYVVMASPNDESDFADRLVKLHQEQSQSEA